jgi:hypothetical protein
MKFLAVLVLLSSCATPMGPRDVDALTRQFRWNPVRRFLYLEWRKTLDYRPQDRPPRSNWTPKYLGWQPSPRQKV